MASRPFYQVADRILGTQFLEDIAEFFLLFQTMAPGFIDRAQAVTRLLHDWRTTFVVVTTLEAAPAHEAEFFIDVLASKKFHLGAVVLNKVLPSYLRDERATVTADGLVANAAAIAAQAGPRLGSDVDPGQVQRVLTEVGESFRRFQLVAQREAEEQAALGRIPDVVATVPYFDTDIYDLSGLLRLGEQVWT
jgi:anion-transporting  ArsA/GET3 family ATPase